jgi:hypothetical protein
MPIALIANGLLIGKAIRLYSKCHDHYWTATYAEREELRKSLAALEKMDVQPTRGPDFCRDKPAKSPA